MLTGYLLLTINKNTGIIVRYYKFLVNSIYF